MSTNAWIFMIGFRVLDVGLLIVWLVWFFRLRGDDDAPDEDGPGGGGGTHPRPRRGPGGGGDRLPIGRMLQGERRARDHARRDERGVPRRGSEPMRQPDRVRRPRTPAPAHRRG